MADIHVWIEHNGKIVDPEMPSYARVRDIRGLVDKQRYEENTTLRETIMPTVKKHLKAYKTLSKWSTEQVLRDFYNEPKNNMCHVNAYAYKCHHPDSRIVIGKMGWERPDGTVFWEFG